MRLRQLVTLPNLLLVLLLVAVSAGSATASALITGKQIKDGTVTGKDIKNRSLAAKDFKAGQLPAGPQGPAGPAGATGPAGPAGPAGPWTGTLPAGQTLSGVWAMSRAYGAVADDVAYTGVSYGLTLAAEPTVRIVNNEAFTPECPGSHYAPTAAPGFLCIYVHFDNGLNSFTVGRMASAGDPNSTTATAGVANRHGFTLGATAIGSSYHVGRGSWAVTAPE